MRLIIREYLSLLRESGELDSLIPDLLAAMDIAVVIRPQVGARQYGVDVAAIGPDRLNDGRRSAFLFVIKRGDIGRHDWDSGPQAVRQSLNETIDVSIPQFRSQYPGLPIKVVLCTNGDLRQDTQANWAGYTNNHSQDDVRFELWTADVLAELIDNYFLSEYIFPAASRDDIRRTLALINVNEYDLQDFRNFLERTLFEDTPDSGPEEFSAGVRLRKIRLITLATRIVAAWGSDRGNLAPSLRACELALLRSWHWIRRADVVTLSALVGEFGKLHSVYRSHGLQFFRKVQSHCAVRDSLFGYGPELVEYPLQTFEIIGILSTIGLSHLDPAISDDTGEGAELATEMARSLVEIVRNNPSARSPSFDGHAIDLNAGVELLVRTGLRTEALEWVEDTLSRVFFAYRTGENFPISTDSYEDLVDLHFGADEDSDHLLRTSSLVPLLIEWLVVLGGDDAYRSFVGSISDVMPDTTLQVWHADDSTEASFFSEDASNTGVADAPIVYPDTVDELRQRVIRLRSALGERPELSCTAQGWRSLSSIASRHFRSPVLASYRQDLLVEDLHES